MLLLPTLLLYALGLLLTGIGSRLASLCATWCGALCGLPMWMVGGTLVAVCTALPQLVLAFLAARYLSSFRTPPWELNLVFGPPHPGGLD